MLMPGRGFTHARVSRTQLRQDWDFRNWGMIAIGTWGAARSELTFATHTLGRHCAMRATIKNYLEAEKIRREEEGREGGFSLIELIIVVVILGVLVAIAIPLFANIQYQAQLNALKAAAANGATAAAAALAQVPAGDPAVAAATAGDDGIAVTLNPAAPATIDDVCATAANPAWTITAADAATIPAGPGCP